MTRSASRRAVPWLAVALLVSACAGSGARSAAPAPDAAQAELPPPARQVLRNGMRLIVQDHRASDIVALYLFVGVGVRYEAPDQLGYAHFQEHMLFKGTDRFGPGYVDRTVEGVGGRSNAVTSFDYTSFYLVLPSDATASGIELLADMAFRSSFVPDEIGREREVIFEEARIEQDNPRSAIVRQLYGLVFAGNPYGRPVLGTRPTMQAATQERLRAFNRRYYVPENMTLVVAGPVDPVAVRGDRRPHVRAHAGHRLQARPRARARAAQRRGAPHRGARRAAGPPGPRLAGPALGRRQRRRGGSPRPRSSRAPRARASPSGCVTRSGWSRR